MIPKPPVFLFAFANDKQNSLQLKEEERVIREILQDLHDSRRIEYHSLGASTVDDTYKTFNRFHNRLQLFHFSGHSDHTFLKLEDKNARAINLAVIMGMQQQLSVVVLNGCANYEQVRLLFEMGVKVVIATSTGIEDKRALLFSKAFYQALKGGKTIRESFATTAARLKEDFPEEEIAFRGLISRTGDTLPWGLYAKEDADLDWKIPNQYSIPADLDYHSEVELTNPNTNKVFLESTFEGMAKLNKKCAFLWEDYQDKYSSDTSIYDLQEAIYNQFPSILSIQIRDLFTANAKQKGRLRLHEINEVYLVYSKLLCAIAMASLWEVVIQQNNKPNKFKIRPEFKKDLEQYFNLNQTNADYFDYCWLLATIDRVFIENDLDPFIPELRGLLTSISEKAEIFNAYQFLEFELKRRIQAGNIASIEVEELCELAEQHLGVLMNKGAFLITYQLVSVNDISVKKSLHNSDANFIHNKVILRGVEDTVMDRDPLSRKNYTCNHAVIVTRNFQLEEPPLTLSPFLIDKNAYKIKSREQAKIHFLAGRTEVDNLYYQHAEVLTEGFELVQDERNSYRAEDLEEIKELLLQFGKDLDLHNRIN